MRTVDLARAAGVSTQQIRNYEDAGVLPPVPRTESGYRTFGERHLRAAVTYRALAAGHGPEAARGIMHAVLAGDVGRALEMVDAGHAALHEERAALRTTAVALEAVAGSPHGYGAPVSGHPHVDGGRGPDSAVVDRGRGPGLAVVDGRGASGAAHVDGGRGSGVVAADGGRAGGSPQVDGGSSAAGGAELSVGELAAQLGVRPSALRVWEAAGLLSPVRERVTGYRRYGPAEIRDARMIRMLRQSHYPLPQIAPILDGLRRTGSSDALGEAVARRQATLTQRSAAMLRAAAHLSDYITEFAD